MHLSEQSLLCADSVERQVKAMQVLTHLFGAAQEDEVQQKQLAVLYMIEQVRSVGVDAAPLIAPTTPGGAR